jgi:hypothetical protein
MTTFTMRYIKGRVNVIRTSLALSAAGKAALYNAATK